MMAVIDLKFRCYCGGINCSWSRHLADLIHCPCLVEGFAAVSRNGFICSRCCLYRVQALAVLVLAICITALGQVVYSQYSHWPG